MAGNKRSGRPSKTEEQEILEKLSLLDDLFFEKLEVALQKGNSWAMKLFATHRLPKPRQIQEIDINPEQPIFNLGDLLDGDDE